MLYILFKHLMVFLKVCNVKFISHLYKCIVIIVLVELNFCSYIDSIIIEDLLVGNPYFIVIKV